MSDLKEKVTKTEKKATFGASLLVFLLCTVVILVGILVLKLDAHIPIVVAAAIALVYGIVLHIDYKDLERAMIKTISESVPVLIIICIIGMLVGSWMAAGTVPYVIFLGLKLINPGWFLPFVAIMCAVLSSLTGSSWTTCSTIGVAFMGISIGLGVPMDCVIW
jgi:NhaC family Na+:H+ antiporter